MSSININSDDDIDMESDSISEVGSDDEDSDEINEIYKNESTAVFRLRMVVFVATLLAAVGVVQQLAAIGSLSVATTLYARSQPNTTWPFVTLNDFQQRADTPGVVVVLENTCDGSLTYKVAGEQPEYKGQGDPAFDHMVRYVTFGREDDILEASLGIGVNQAHGDDSTSVIHVTIPLVAGMCRSRSRRPE
jgi:hypothetical protein